MKISKIFISFGIIIFISVSSAMFTIIKMRELSENTRKIYDHPFTVNNAISNIQTSMITMHRDMKDIVLAKDSHKTLKYIQEIEKLEVKIGQNFTLIHKRYLGNKDDVKKSEAIFKAWRPIREEVITLVNNKKEKEATEITQNSALLHMQKAYESIATLEHFALNKAQSLYKESLNNSEINAVIMSFLITLLTASVIILYIVRTLLKVNETNNKHLHLIDQNILTVQLDFTSNIISISSALCRVLHIEKNKILHTKNEYFFTSKEHFESFRQIIYSGKDYITEISIMLQDKILWFKMEIFPQLDSNYKIQCFEIFLTDISDKKKIEEVSITDTLTKIYNRNYFEIIFLKEVQRAKRDNKSLSLYMLDIDYFKQFNDTYGHASGDIALQSVAKVLTARTKRSYDYAFRIGGEEFFIISYQENIKEAEKMGQNIIDDISYLKIDHSASSVHTVLTASIGIILFEPQHLFSTTEMFEKVDALLYQAKNSGRNQFQSDTLC